MVVEISLGLPDASCPSFRLLAQPGRQRAAFVDGTSPVHTAAWRWMPA